MGRKRNVRRASTWNVFRNVWKKGGGAENASSLPPSRVLGTMEASKTSSVSPSMLSGKTITEFSLAPKRDTTSVTETFVGQTGFTSNIVIGILVIALTISLLGNSGLAYIFDVFFRNLVETFSTLASHIAYLTGTVLNTTTNVAANSAITGIELVDGATNEIGNIFRDASASNTNPLFRQQLDRAQDASEKPLLPRHLGAYPLNENNQGEVLPLPQKDLKLDNVINTSGPLNFRKPPKSDDGSTSVIQGPVRASQSAFCFIGNFQGERSCVQIDSGAICNSGALFQTRDKCEQ